VTPMPTRTRTPTPRPKGPPVIISVDFPTKIPADKSQVKGTIKFTDPDRDVNLVIADVVQGAAKGSSSQWDPTQNTQWYPDYGIIEYWTSCGGNQVVTQRIRLKDAAGNISNPVEITFTCQ
jgi:hypothetical protein